MKRIGIIGVGHVGSTVAHTLIERQIADELYLFDEKTNLVESEGFDLWAGQIGTHTTTRLYAGTSDSLAELDVLVFSVGDIAVLNGQGTRFDELAFTKQAAEKWGPIIRTSKFHGILLTITNPCDVITRYLQELTGLPKSKIFGTGTSLDTARFKHAVGEILTIAPDSVDGLILGEHGETQFIAWHATSIGYRPILEQISSEQQEKIEALTFALGEKTFTGKGYTSYGIANQAAQIIDAILTDSHRIFPLSVYHQEANLYIGHAAKVGAQGIEESYPPILSSDEKQKWAISVNWIQTMYDAIDQKE